MDQTPPQGQPAQTPTGFLKSVENELHKLYTKVPWHLPPKAREWIVHYGPWITLIIMILAVPAILALLGIIFGLSVISLPYAGTAVVHPWTGFNLLGLLLSLGVMALEIAALPGLFKRSMSGWNLAFYSILLSAVNSLFMGNWGGLIIGTALSLYVLFEVKSYYK